LPWAAERLPAGAPVVEISVIIPTFNRSETVLRAVESVISQDHPSFEVIVVDDGSNDGTRALMPSAANLKFVVHPSNRGVSAARNTGIRQSSGRLVAFLDSDDYWIPGKLKCQTEFFDANPSAVACQTGERWIRKGRRVNPGLRHMKSSGDIFLASLHLCLVSPSAVMLKKSLLDEVGLFDENLPACEDYDLWLRISYKYPIELIEQEFVVREGGRPDQLSAVFPGMDLFRIRSLIKLMGSYDLTGEQQAATLDVLTRKTAIYAAGCMKRGRVEEARFIRSLAERASLALTGNCAPPKAGEIPLRFLKV